MKDRVELLKAAIKHTAGDRDVEYGSPYFNLSDCAALWTTYIIGKFRGTSVDENTFALTAEDVAHLNVLQKIARTFSGKVKLDTYEDIAAYGAIAGECAQAEEEDKE